MEQPVQCTKSVRTAGRPGLTTLLKGKKMSEIHGTAGDEVLQGSDGLDTAVLADALGDVTWQYLPGPILQVTSARAGVDRLDSIERVQAAGATISVDTGGVVDQRLADRGPQDDVSRVVPLADGGWLLVWEAGFRATTVRGMAYEHMSVYAQRFDAGGAATAPEALAAGPVNSGWVTPAAAALAGGGSVVAWAGSGSIMVQRLDPTGAKLGAAVPVATASAYSSDPELLALPDGGWIVAWAAPDAEWSGIFSRRFGADGAPVDLPVQVNTTSAAGQTQPALALTSDGGHVIAWTSQAGADHEVRTQRFDPAGAPIGAETVVSANATGADVATLAGGGHVVTWYDAAGGSRHVRAQTFDATGQPAGAQLQVDMGAPAAGDPAVAALPDGGFFVTWAGYPAAGGPSPDGREIFGQRFDGQGERVGGEMQINARSVDNQSAPDVAALADGSVVVTWTAAPNVAAPGLPTDVFLQRLDANGVPDTSLTLSGGDTADVLRMTSAAERVKLDGGAGDDLLAGAPATWDVLAGGSGSDVFEFAAAGNGEDFILDWARGDRITVAGADFGGAVTSGDGGSLVANRRLMDALRSINEMVFAMIFVVAVGLGPFAGVLALFVHTTGILAKLFSEAVESIDPRPVEGVRATGATALEEIVFGVIPQVMPLWISYSLYRFESNVRSATVVGMVGAGGIGVIVWESIRGFYFAQTCAQMLVIILSVSLLDLASAQIRKRFI